MLNLITTISVGCFDTLAIPGKTYVFENNEGEIIIQHVTETEYMINTMTYCLTKEDEIKSMIAYLKHLYKTPHIFVFNEKTKAIKKIL